MKFSNVAGALLVSGPCMSTAWGFIIDEPQMLVRRSYPDAYRQGEVFGINDEGLELYQKLRKNPGHSGTFLEAIQDKLLTSLGSFQQMHGVLITVGTNSPREANPKYITKPISKEEAKELEGWLNGLSHAHRRDEITKASIGVNSRITGRNYDGADAHRAVLHKYIDIIRGCPMFSSPSEEEISIPHGELDDNNWCQVAFGEVALETKNTSGSLLSKFQDLKQKFLHHIKEKRDRGFSFLDFGDPAPIERREDFWTKIVEDTDDFNVTDDTENKKIEKGRTFEKRDFSMLESPEKDIEKSFEYQLKSMVEDIERDILFRFPYESDYKRKEAWEAFQEKKADLKHKYKLDKDSYSDHHKSVYKRDIWEDLQRMRGDFQDKLPFPGNEIQKRDIWEEIEKAKQQLQDSLPSFGQDEEQNEVQKRDIWEEIEKAKQEFQDKVSSLDGAQDGVQRRDIWEVIEKSNQEFQDKWSFLDQGKDGGELEKRDMWEEIEKAKKQFQDKLVFLAEHKDDVWEEVQKMINELQDKWSSTDQDKDEDKDEEGSTEVQKRAIGDLLPGDSLGNNTLLNGTLPGHSLLEDLLIGTAIDSGVDELKNMLTLIEEEEKKSVLNNGTHNNDKGGAVQVEGISDELKKLKQRLLDLLRAKQAAQKAKKELLDKLRETKEEVARKKDEADKLKKELQEVLPLPGDAIMNDAADKLKKDLAEKEAELTHKKEEAEKLRKGLFGNIGFFGLEDATLQKRAESLSSWNKEKRSWWCPWCANPVVEEKPVRHIEPLSGVEIDIPVKKSQDGDVAPSGWLWDEVRDGLINIGGKLENTKHSSIEQNLSPAKKLEPDEAGDDAPSGWLWNEIKGDLVNVEGKLVDVNDIVDINVNWK